MKQIIRVFSLIFVSCILSGCLYPKERIAQQIPAETSVQQVQEAVEAYQSENNGLLPIKNKDSEMDQYIKYLIDFTKLVPQYLPEIPANAYEAGGVFQYVIIIPETNPTVKIFDMEIAERIREINIRLSMQKYPPFKEVIQDNVFSLDFNKLGYEQEPVIISPFSGQNLPFIISSDGEIYVDYSADIYQILQEKDVEQVEKYKDLRSLLVEDSIFVPAYSLPYIIDDFGAPVFIIKN
ncbi:hypothetical protein [Pallidibacillus pasinlerensis]|uniref:ABC transporter periplasmic binding protein yphF n=1 Tax=Pallidibacillus pasinlerensis TaxID=2703818 RepID=A0ABX0A5A5_9BACI|nr:hypothetical protein [Pallidibacillus pasinlerensis]NCU16373.1 hypothetical protein [Pallidibacillus pasinlerensis]